MEAIGYLLRYGTGGILKIAVRRCVEVKRDLHPVLIGRTGGGNIAAGSQKRANGPVTKRGSTE